MKILLVDDDAFLRDMYATKFTERGYAIDVAGTSEAALTKLHESTYDVVLMDMIMPGMDGIELLRHIHTEKLGGTPLCIMLTNQSEETDKTKAIEAGAVGYIVKAELIPSEVVTELERLVALKKVGGTAGTKIKYMASVDYKRELEDLIDIVVTEKGSDIHLSVGSHPIIRVDGSLIPLVKKPILTNHDVAGFIKVLLSEEQEVKFLETREVDFSYAAKDGIRFRGNGFFQRGSLSVALRHIPHVVRNFKDLALPSVLESFTQRPQGFFLCVGPVGQGKSTTLAAMIELINQTRSEHIVTIEDPIEYIFEPKKSLIDQREVRVDTADFHTGLHSAFRQDVDVIMVGEMRGRDTISTAVTAAETGHLVFSTLHTNNAAQTIDRIIDTFPAGQQDQIRVQLSGSLTAIFSQRLVPRISGGLVPAYELLINNAAVSNLIREKRTHEIQTVIETGMEIGMIDMNRSLVELVQKGEITVENAFAYSVNPKGLERLM